MENYLKYLLCCAIRLRKSNQTVPNCIFTRWKLTVRLCKRLRLGSTHSFCNRNISSDSKRRQSGSVTTLFLRPSALQHARYSGTLDSSQQLVWSLPNILEKKKDFTESEMHVAIVEHSSIIKYMSEAIKIKC